MIREQRSLMEPLESRTLLSVSVGGVASSALGTGAIVQSAAPAATGVGITIHVTAGVPFTKEVAFYPSPVLDPPGVYTATINWGDGFVSKGTLTYGSNGNTPGYEIKGSHVYANAGTFKVTTTLSLTSPAAASVSAAPTSTVVATITSSAIVAARPAISPTGVTLTELAGKAFTADVGAVFLPAVQNGIFTATINWGDGTSSAGQLSPTKITNASGETEYEVIGGHTYLQAGDYPILIVVKETSPNVVTLDSIHSGGIVHAPIPLGGTITGSYRLDLFNPITGIVSGFSGSGTVATLGAVTMTGTIKRPGLATSPPKATGTITLTNASGSVKLRLTGPTEKGGGPIPGTMDYSIISGSGAYFDSTGSGTITITLVPSTTSSLDGTFTFVLS